MPARLSASEATLTTDVVELHDVRHTAGRVATDVTTATATPGVARTPMTATPATTRQRRRYERARRGMRSSYSGPSLSSEVTNRGTHEPPYGGSLCASMSRST